MVEQRAGGRRDGGEAGRATLEDLYRQIQAGQAKELRIILKADVSGLARGDHHALEQLSQDEVDQRPPRGRRRHHRQRHPARDSRRTRSSSASAPSITDTARRRPRPRASTSACTTSSTSSPTTSRRPSRACSSRRSWRSIEGRAEVRQIFKVGKSTVIAGCYVTDGRIVRGGARVWRGGKVIATDRIDSLRRFRDDVREVARELRVRHRPGRVPRPRRGRHHRVLHEPVGEPGSSLSLPAFAHGSTRR
jgi:translation initiation factor IF-2